MMSEEKEKKEPQAEEAKPKKTEAKKTAARSAKKSAAKATKKAEGAPALSVEEIVDLAKKMDDKEQSELVRGVVRNMRVISLSGLVKDLEEEFGVTAAAPAVAAVSAPPQAEEEEAEKTIFDVVLEAAGDKKIPVIKVVRSLTSLGLKDAKALVDGAPKKIKEGVSKEEAEKIKAELETVGATVKLE
jgi:large subunit ribosomal protein L7/L12